MILLSKASASFTELGWSAQLFLVRESCNVYKVPGLTNVICPMLLFCMKMYQVYPNTTHKNEVGITKITFKMSKETRNRQSVERFVVLKLGASVCANIVSDGCGKRNLQFSHPLIFCSDRLPDAAGRVMTMRMKRSAKQWKRKPHWRWLSLTRWWTRTSWSKPWNISGIPSAMVSLRIHLKLLPWYPILLSGQMIKVLKMSLPCEFFSSPLIC